MFKKKTFALVVVLVLIQFFGIDKTNPTISEKQDFIATHQPEQTITASLRAACYDCHSNETKYPWYTSIAPVSWWIKGHITEGREHLNFSTWETYDAKKKEHKLEECIEEMEKHKMPLSSYTWLHSDAALSDKQRNELIAYFKSLR